MRRVLGAAGLLALGLGCSGLGSLGQDVRLGEDDGDTEADAVAPAESKFGHWALPEELAGRARAAGWEIERCERYDDGRWVTTACDLRRDGAYAFVSIDELPSADEAKEQASYAEPNEAVTRDGNLVMFARVFDRETAAGLRDAVGPEGEPVRLLDQDLIGERVASQGWTLSWCDEVDLDTGSALDCEIKRGDAVGFLELDRTEGGGGFRGEDRLLEGPAALVDQGDAVLAVEIPDSSSAHALVVGLLAATPVEEVPEPVPVPVPVPDPAPAAAPAPATAPAPAPAPAVSGIPVTVSGGAEVVLVGDGERYPLPTAVPVGRYVIEATFPGKSSFEAGKITVLEGQRPVVACRASLGICRAR